jgi:hypothetical protein
VQKAFGLQVSPEILQHGVTVGEFRDWYQIEKRAYVFVYFGFYPPKAQLELSLNLLDASSEASKLLFSRNSLGRLATVFEK